MNGFVNTLLSLMLSWIRAIISNIWTMLNSEDGGSLYQFLRANWLAIVISLCVICLLVDLIVYFFRWRPDYLWAARWRRLRRPSRSKEKQEMPYPLQQEPEPQPAAPTMAYAPLQAATAVYAPVSQPTQVWQPVQEVEDPVFDDAALWENEEPMELDWQTEEQPAFGTPQPEPLAYFRDVQAGFAPPVPPEELYAPAVRQQRFQQPDLDLEAVHPGLDEETFRQTIGLEESAAPAPVIHAPAFRPFTVTHEPEPERPQGAFQRFAQKARDFMALDDEQKTIRDLQSSVDVSKAFHEPVYPQSFKHDEE